MDQRSLHLAAESVAAAPFAIPGATGGEFRIQILNEDAGRGVVTSIVHIPAGGRIPAHRHRAGPEMHYLLEGDLAEAGRELAPGGFLTHAAGVLHGPHESRGGARVLTVQGWQSHDGDFDFEPAEDQAAPPRAAGDPAPDQDGSARPDRQAAPPRNGGDPAPGGKGAVQPVDQGAQEEAREEASRPDRAGYG